MDTFFSLLKKGLVATVFIMFAFVATYIPQPYNNVQEAEAGGGGVGGATLPMQQPMSPLPLRLVLTRSHRGRLVVCG